MKIGDKVKSQLYGKKGTGTITDFSELFGVQYAEILFRDGNTITIKTDDLIAENDPVSLLQMGKVEQPTAFWSKQMLLRLHANVSENTIVTSTNYKIQPLPHQLLTVNFVMNRFEPRSLIADEVGLGKTIEAILVYQEFKLRGIAKKILIVVPSGLVLQWHEELATKFNEKFVIYSKDYIRALKQSYGEETNVWTLHDKIIVSIDSIKPLKVDSVTDNRELARRQWHNDHIYEDVTKAGFDIVIIDEAHKLSKHGDGRESARYKLGEKLSESVPVFLLLTATPHQGDEALFLNLLRLIDPVLFTGRQSLTPALVQEVAVRNKKRAAVDFDGKRIFKHRITSIIEIERKIPDNQEEIELYEFVTDYTSKYYNYARNANNQIMMLLVMLYQRIVSSSSFAILDTMQRRRAVLAQESRDLSQAIIEDSEDDDIDFDEILQKAFFERKEEIEHEKQFVEACITKAEVLTKTHKDSKFRKLIEVIDEIKKREQNPELKFLIFTEFRATQTAINQFLAQFGYSCSQIHGSLSRDEKVEQVELFRTTNQVMVSTDAGGEGINLQFCYCMINFDLPWNPSRIEQRIGRLDRIGQKHDVLIFNFHLTDTVEDRVRGILETKLQTIKDQFGEDKYADILTLLQDEFSFDRIYIDAVQIKEAENKQLDLFADKLFKSAKKILEKDELLLPFSDFAQEATELVNKELNSIIKSLVLNFLKSKNVGVNWYKDEKDFCYFDNPFPRQLTEPAVYRNITFENSASTQKAKVDFVNIEHSLIKSIQQEFEQNSQLGSVSAYRLSINKFQNMSGFWFIYRLSTSNHIDKSKISLVTVFMEDDSFSNNRISNYLESSFPEESELVQNYSCKNELKDVAKAAIKFAEEKANNIFSATKITWLNEINTYEKKFEDYFRFKQNAYSKLHIANIRDSKLQSLQKDKEEQILQLKLKRNIIPKLTLYQAAYVEFV